MSEQSPTQIPDEIKVEEPVFMTNDVGKKYLTEEGGTYYGGDYLPKPPEEITVDTDFPGPPEEIPTAVL
jgi:hypothetical protein